MTPTQQSVAAFGTRGDGVTDDGAAFQQALDSRPGHLHVPAGTYRVGRTLRIHGGTHLHLDAEATLRLGDGAAQTSDDYLLTNANPEAGDADITIEGGTWDGNNPGNPRPPGLFAEGYTGAMIHFRNVTGLRLLGLRLHNAEAYYVRLTHARRFHIEGIRFSSDRVRRNNDGIHLGGNCEHGVIRDLKGLHPGVTGDDLVALNADDALDRNEVRGMTSGPIRHIVIEDLEAESCHSFVRLLSFRSPIEDVTIRRVRGTCTVAALNCDAGRGCAVKLFDEANPPFAGGVGLLRDIAASDFVVAKAAANDCALLRFETRMVNVTVTDFRRDRSRDLAPGCPTLRVRHTAVGRLTLQPGERDESVVEGGLFEWEEDEISRLTATFDGEPSF